MAFSPTYLVTNGRLLISQRIALRSLQGHFVPLISGLRSGERFTGSLNLALDSVLDKLAQIATDTLFSGGGGGGINSFIDGLVGGVLAVVMQAAFRQERQAA